MMLRSLASVAASVLLAGCSLAGIRSGYEEPPYSIVERIDGEVEIRRYAGRLAAETTVPTREGEAGRSEAFKSLFDYISGDNRGASEIAMTVPVEVGATGEEIAMTVPVETGAATGGRDVMRFFLPTSYTKATAPHPTDPSVRIVDLPAATVAVLRFSGSWDDARLKTRKAELLRALADSSWRSAGSPTNLFYDPPWTIPFLRRNEVAVAVTRTSEGN